jgi:hypothetical protein
VLGGCLNKPAVRGGSPLSQVSASGRLEALESRVGGGPRSHRLDSHKPEESGHIM